MFVQFTCKNYKSFKEDTTFSLVASNYDKTTRASDNIKIIEKFDLKLLKSAVVYGANASGKTKFIEAIAFMRQFVLNSSKESQIEEAIDVKPFLLSAETIGKPSVFELVFLHEGSRYRYGFEVNAEKIVAEWLYEKERLKEVEIFYREGQAFQIHERKFKVTDLIENDRIRPNALLLSVAASWNDQLAKKLLDWFRQCNVISGIEQENYEGYSMVRIRDNEKNKAEAIAFLKSADLGIDHLSIETVDVDKLSSNFPQALKEAINRNNKDDKELEMFSDVKTYHKVFGSDKLVKDFVAFSMKDDESSGTKKYFALSGPILETLKRGSILIVDEMANKLHPNLVHRLIELFNSKEHNPLHAQLIFTTHDTNLLDSKLLRRDQIWFTEKDRYGASKLYSLSDFKGVRKNENYESNYLKGKYGAVPYLEDFFTSEVMKYEDEK